MSDIGLRIRVAMDTAQGENALARFRSAVRQALRELGRSDAEIGIIERLVADVEAGRRKLAELPAEHRAVVAQITRQSSAMRILDEPGLVASISRIRSALLGLTASFSSVPILRMADSMALLSARLRLVEGSERAAAQRLLQLTEIANRAGADVEAVAASYARMSASLRGAGASTEQAMRFVEALALALRVSGASAAEASSTMYQLGQALQRGRLQGDEFASVAENGGRVLDYLAQAMGTTRGELSRMAEQGELTAQRMLALADALESIRQDAASMPRTVGAAFAGLANAAKRWVAEADSVSVATRGLIAVVDKVAKHFGALTDVLLVLAGGAIAQGVARLIGSLRAVGGIAAAFAGLHPVVRVTMIALSALTLLETPLRRLWDALMPEDPTARLRQLAGETRATMDALGKVTQQTARGIGERLADAVRRAGAGIADLARRWGDLRAANDAALSAQLANIDALTASRLQAAARGAQGELEKVRATTAAVLAGESEKLKAVRMATEQALAAWDSTYRRAVDIAQRAGLDVRQIERDGLVARLEILSRQEQAYRQTVDRLIAEEQRHTEAARKAAEERAALRMSVEDRVRALRQRTMSEEQAYQDRLRQIEEKQEAARRALYAGRFEDARRLAEQAIQLAEANANAVTRTVERGGSQVTETVVSEAQAVARAITDIRAAAGIADAALRGLESAHARAARAAGDGAKEAADALAGVQDQIDRLQNKLDKGLQLRIDIEADALEDLVGQISRLRAAEVAVGQLEAKIRDLNTALERARDIGMGGLSLTVRIDALEDALAEAQASLANAGLRIGIDVEDVRAQLDAVRSAAQRPSLHVVEADTRAAEAAIERLKRPTSSVHTVYVRQVERRASGGLVGLARRITGRVGGPGTGTSDSVPAMLSAGEYVIRASAVRRYGAAMLDQINRGTWRPAAQVPMPAQPPREHASDSLSIRLLSPGGQAARLRSTRDDARAMLDMLRAAGVRLEAAP